MDCAFNERKCPPAHEIVTSQESALFIIALYLFSTPTPQCNPSWGYWVLHRFIPSSILDPRRFVHGVKAALLVVSVSFMPVLQCAVTWKD